MKTKLLRLRMLSPIPKLPLPGILEVVSLVVKQGMLCYRQFALAKHSAQCLMVISQMLAELVVT